MLAANVATARFLDKHDLPALYRIHERPTPERLDKLRLFLNELGLAVGGGDMPTRRIIRRYEKRLPTALTSILSRR